MNYENEYELLLIADGTIITEYLVGCDELSVG
jgi:hypothetical protein